MSPLVRKRMDRRAFATSMTNAPEEEEIEQNRNPPGREVCEPSAVRLGSPGIERYPHRERESDLQPKPASF